MFRSIPVSNKICFDKQLKRNWKIHEQKLNQMKSKLSKQRAQQFTFLQQSKKRNVLKDIKNRQIERSNHILFKRIQEIQRKGSKNSYVKLNNHSSCSNSVKLLHEPYRKRQLVRIVQENQDMLKRIRDKKSSYNVRKMEKQRKDVEKNISLISQFKYKDFPATHTQVNFYVTQEKSGLGNSRISNNRQSNSKQRSQFEPRCKTSFKSRFHNNVNNKFFQGTKLINYAHYIVSAYLTKSMFYVEMENIKNHLDKYRLQMTQAQVFKLLQQFYGNKIESLIENLDIDPETQECYLKYKKQNQINHQGNKTPQYKEEIVYFSNTN